MAGEHANVLMATEAPAKRAFAVDLHEPEGWVEVAEFASLLGAQDARDKIAREGRLVENGLRVRGERVQRLASKVWLGILTVLAVVNGVLYAVILTAE